MLGVAVRRHLDITELGSPTLKDGVSDWASGFHLNGLCWFAVLVEDREPI